MSALDRITGAARAYQEGKVAFREGKQLLDNPYRSSSVYLETGWRFGFQDQEEASKKPRRGRKSQLTNEPGLVRSAGKRKMDNAT